MKCCRRACIFDTPSPHIPWDSLPVRVVDKAIPWEPSGRPRRAGSVPSGSPAPTRTLIEEAPATADEPTAAPTDTPDVNVLALSARSPGSTHRAGPAFTTPGSNRTRTPTSPTCASRRGPAGRTSSTARRWWSIGPVRPRRPVRPDREPAAARGAAWRARQPPHHRLAVHRAGQPIPGYGAGTVRLEPVFAETVRQCAAAVADIVERPLLDAVRHRPDTGDDGKSLRHTSYAQPALFAVEMGLARLWQSLGIEPDVVLGHSVGQYAAACVAGVFSLEDGARLIAERGRLFGSLPEGGRMVATSSPIPSRSKRPRPISPGVGGRLQRTQHRAVGPRRGPRRSSTGSARTGSALHLAGDQPRLPLRAARSRARRIRVLRSD